MNDKTLTVGLVALLLLIAAILTRNGDIAWMGLPFWAYLLLGILQTPDLEKLSCKATRILEQSRLHGIVSIAVRLAVENNGPETVHLLVEETAQPGMQITEGELSQRVSLRPGEAAELKYAFTAARGNFAWKFTRIRVSDPLGVIESEVFLPDNTTVQVRPQIRKFKSIAFRPRKTVHTPGSIPARIGGSGTDFYGVREYHPGDSLRTLDWRLTARHPRRLFTREFEQEEIAEIGLILDARPNTELRIGGESLFEHSVSAAASLAEMFLHQGHRLSLLIFGEKMLTAFPGYGKRQLHRILNYLSKAEIGSETPALGSLDYLPTRVFPPHALVVVISPLTSNDRSFFQRLRAHGYQPFLVSPDPLHFASSTLPKDTDSQLAARATAIERRLQLNEIAQLQVPTVDWQVDQPLFPLVRNALKHSREGRRL